MSLCGRRREGREREKWGESRMADGRNGKREEKGGGKEEKGGRERERGRNRERKRDRDRQRPKRR